MVNLVLLSRSRNIPRRLLCVFVISVMFPHTPVFYFVVFCHRSIQEQGEMKIEQKIDEVSLTCKAVFIPLIHKANLKLEYFVVFIKEVYLTASVLVININKQTSRLFIVCPHVICALFIVFIFVKTVLDLFTQISSRNIKKPAERSFY